MKATIVDTPVINNFEVQEAGDEKMVRFGPIVVATRGEGDQKEGFLILLDNDLVCGAVHVIRTGADEIETFEMPSAIADITETIHKDTAAGKGDRIDHIGVTAEVMAALWLDDALNGQGPNGLTITIDKVTYPVRLYEKAVPPMGNYIYATMTADDQIV